VCDFEDKNGNKIQRILSAKTSVQAEIVAMGTGQRLGIDPDYSTIRHATQKEVRDFKNMIKNRVIITNSSK
jgi:hypothetical protein